MYCKKYNKNSRWGYAYIYIYIKESLVFIRLSEITKHSKNIIDLIEMGDYVNGERVIEVIKGHDEDTYILHVVSLNTYKFITKKEIKIILTHEQYEQNCYRLEE